MVEGVRDDASELRRVVVTLHCVRFSAPSLWGGDTSKTVGKEQIKITENAGSLEG